MFSTIFGAIKGIKVSKYFLIGIGIAALIAIAIFTIKYLTDTAVDQAETVGGNKVVIEAQEKGIEDVKAAKDAREELERNPSARRIECLRNNRRPENCPSE